MSTNKTKYYLVVQETVVKASSKTEARTLAKAAAPVSEEVDQIPAALAKELLNS